MTSKEALERAKSNRIIQRGGMTKKRLSAKDNALAKMIGLEKDNG